MARIDPERIHEILSGVDVNDKDALASALGTFGFEMCAAAAEDWQGNTLNDEIARAIIAGMRILVESFTARDTEGELSPMMFALGMKQFNAIATNMSALDSLAKLR